MTTSSHETHHEIPFLGRWDASRSEKIADGVVHAVGLIAAIIASGYLLALAFPRTGSGEFAAAVVYVSALVAGLAISLAYNSWPLTPAKWVLRRIDHSLIYILIAATYTPFLIQLPDSDSATLALVAIWSAALAGVTLKLFLPGRFDRLAVAFYLATGWSGVLLVGPLSATLTHTTLLLIAAGGLTYTVGVIFYIWRSLRYNSALWHTFVVTAALLHSFAVLDCLAISRM